MQDDLIKNILNTICYYDVLNYPLTVFEIWKHLLLIDKNPSIENQEKYSISDVLRALDQFELKKFTDNKNGFYFLKGREFLVEQRISRGKISALKLRRMRLAISFLRIVPFLRMVLVTGRLAMKNARPKSDWDVLIVLKNRRIWIGRTIITLWAHFLGKRRHHDKIKDRLCFNYFITTDSLEIRNKDLFSANEYFFCFPLFDAGNYFHKFQLRNIWIRKYKPNYYLAVAKNAMTLRDNKFTKFFRLLGENILDHNFLENYLERIEKNKIKNNPKTSKINSLIDTDKKALIFLPNPQGPLVFEKFRSRLAGIGIYKK